MEIALTNRPQERPRLLEALQGFARENQLPAPVVQAADLALEEHLSNILSYAYADAGSHHILVRLVIEEHCLLIEVEDDGKPFNPLASPAVNTKVPLDEKPIGGLGIHLILKFMDEVRYRRERDRNILTMRKRLGTLPSAN